MEFFFKHVKYEMGLINRGEEIEGIFKKIYKKKFFLCIIINNIYTFCNRALQ